MANNSQHLDFSEPSDPVLPVTMTQEQEQLYRGALSIPQLNSEAPTVATALQKILAELDATRRLAHGYRVERDAYRSAWGVRGQRH